MDVEIEGPVDDLESLVADEDEAMLGDPVPAMGVSQTCITC